MFKFFQCFIALDPVATSGLVFHFLLDDVHMYGIFCLYLILSFFRLLLCFFAFLIGFWQGFYNFFFIVFGDKTFWFNLHCYFLFTFSLVCQRWVDSTQIEGGYLLFENHPT